MVNPQNSTHTHNATVHFPLMCIYMYSEAQILWCPPAFHEVTCYAVDVHVYMYIGLVCTCAWQDMYVQLSLNVGERKVIPTQRNKTINTRNMEKGPLECPQL